MPPKEISETVRQQLIRIRDTHGAQKPFLAKAGIYPSTLHRLIEAGSAAAPVVDRVLDALQPSTRDITPADLLRYVCAEYQVQEAEIKNPPRKSPAGEARQIIVWLLSRETRLSYADIAAHVGFADHTGVMAALKTITNRMDVETDLRRKAFNLRSKIYQ